MQQTKVYIFKSLVCVAVQKILQIFKKICTNLINHVKRRLSKKGEPYKKKKDFYLNMTLGSPNWKSLVFLLPLLLYACCCLKPPHKPVRVGIDARSSQSQFCHHAYLQYQKASYFGGGGESVNNPHSCQCKYVCSLVTT